MVAAVALLATGCSQIPPYHRPEVATAPAFKEAPGWRLAAPSDAIAKGAWWELFDDPVLTALELRVPAANQTVAGLAAAYAQARATVKEQRAALFPTVDLTGGYTRSGSFGKSSSTVVVGTGGSDTGSGGDTGTGSSGSSTSVLTRTGASHTITLGLGATWEPDLFGRIGATVKQARGLEQAAGGDLANAILAAQGELATDYLQLRALDAQTRILDDTIAAYTRNTQITTNRYNAGVVGKVDVLQAETQLRNARGDAEDLVRQRAILEHAIAVLVGESPDAFVIAPVAWAPVVPAIPAALPSEVIERRPDIAAAERRVAAANANVGIQRAAFFPTVDLTGNIGTAASNFANLVSASSSFWSLGLNVAETLLDFGARKARVREARAAYDQAVANYRQAVLTAFQQVNDDLAAARVLAQVGQERTAAADVASRAEQLLQNQYLAGQIAYTDVITQQAAALAAREQAVLAALDRQTAAVALIQAIGGSWAGVPVQTDSRSP